MPFFDAHTHVHFAAFKDDSEEVIARALKDDVWMITVGTQKDTSRSAVETANKYEAGVYAAIGLHPVHTDRAFHDENELGPGGGDGFTLRGEVFDHDHYLELGRNKKTVAVGECGLDYFRIEGEVEEKRSRQKEAFESQIALAHELGKPLMIHCREAFPDLIAMLRESRSLWEAHPGVIHFFTGTPQDARELLDLGFSFTFGGVTTFARNYDEAIALIPKENILSETDAPYVAPAPMRGKRNEPAFVVHTVKKLAELKGLAVEEMQAQIFRNAQRIFKI